VARCSGSKTVGNRSGAPRSAPSPASEWTTPARGRPNPGASVSSRSEHSHTRAVMTIPALRAIIFDFNGVIVDDETTHFLAFQQALAEDGLALTKEAYYGTYLGMDERTCASALLEATTDQHDPARVKRIAERKAALFASLTETRRPPLFPGVVDFVTRASTGYRLASASGVRCQHSELALHDTPSEGVFAVLLSAEAGSVGRRVLAMFEIVL